MRKGILAALLLPSLALAVEYRSDDVGTVGAAFLGINVSSRAAGLGDAFTGVAEGVDTLRYNVAGLAAESGSGVVFTHVDWLLDTGLEYLGVVSPAFGGAIGGGLCYFHSPPIEIYDDSGIARDVVSYSDLATSFAFGREFYGVGFGLGLNMTMSAAGAFAVTGFSFDQGVRWDVPTFTVIGMRVKKLRIGAALNNLGWGSDDYPQPVTASLGISYRFAIGRDALLVAMDLRKPFYGADALASDWRFNMGMEYDFREVVRVRGGLKLGYDNDWFGVGVGVRYNFRPIAAHVDYVWSQFEYFGGINRFSVKATQDLGAAIDKDVRSRKADRLYYQGVSRYIQGDLVGAIELWEQVLGLLPGDERAMKKIEETRSLMEIMDGRTDEEAPPGEEAAE